MFRTALYVGLVLAAIFTKVSESSCPILSSDSVDIVCRYHGKVMQCNSTILPGTKATLACKLFHEIPAAYDQGYREIACLPDGTWDRTVFDCVPICGKAMTHGQALIANGFTSKHGAFPWHVGIYQENTTGEYDYICGGTLVKPDLVISVAHCFYDDFRKTVRRTREFRVAAGKFYRFYIWPEQYAQKSRIKRIDIPKKYSGFIQNYVLDIAMVRLDTPLTITRLVRPVCMDWDNAHKREQLQDGEIGKTVGWGMNASGTRSHELQEVNLPYVTHQDCTSAVPPDFEGLLGLDKFCAGYLNGTSVCPGDSGSGLCFESIGVWYLRGIASVAPSSFDTDRPCRNNDYAVFTDVGYHVAWIRRVYFSQGIHIDERRSCILPDQPADGNFRLSSCRNHSSCDVAPGRRVPMLTMLIYECDKGFFLQGHGGSVCFNNGWYRTASCKKFCPPLRSTNIVCKYEGEVTSCAKRMMHGTKATCGTFYKFSDNRSEISCLGNGSWDYPVPRCIPECGRTVDEETPLIINGSAVAHDEFPWIAHIDVLDGRFLPRIGLGSLISPDLVLTTMWTGYTVYKMKDLKMSELRVLVGQYNTLHDNVRHHSQESSVKQITNSSEGSIMLIHLTTPFVMTTLVRPVCLDWDNRLAAQQLSEGNIGRMPDGMMNDTNLARVMNFTYVRNQRCFYGISPREIELGTGHFCTEPTNAKGEKYNSPDLGSGICFQSDGLWYLRGMISGIQSERLTMFGYRNIGAHIKWIKAAYNVRKSL